MNIADSLKTALALRNQKQWSECLNLIVSLKPEHLAHSRYHKRLLLECYFHLDKLALAHQTLMEALTLNPEGRELEALIYWQKRLESTEIKDDSSLHLLQATAIKNLHQKNFKAALSEFQILCQKFPQDAKHRYHLAIASLESGDLIQAITNLKVCVKLDCLMQKAWYALGSIYLAEGLINEALAYYTEGYSANPFNADGLANHEALKKLRGN